MTGFSARRSPGVRAIVRLAAAGCSGSVGAAGCVAFACISAAACSGWNPWRPLDRESPAVREAVSALDAGDAAAAASTLEDYLSTGPCKDGSIGTPDLLARRPDGTFDLGLSLFRIGEHYGRRFGDEEVDAGVSEAARARRHAQVTCARQILQAVENAESEGAELRAQSRYLEGNLAFLDGEYEEAVSDYDRALVLSPGEVDSGDPVGRDAAWNRAIALRRIDDARDAGHPDASGDAASPRDGGDAGEGPRDSGPRPDAASNRPDGNDAGSSPPPDDADAAPSASEAGAPPPPSGQDERMLDQLENAPTLQQEEAKRYGKRRVRGMADK